MKKFTNNLIKYNIRILIQMLNPAIPFIISEIIDCCDGNIKIIFIIIGAIIIILLNKKIKIKCLK